MCLFTMVVARKSQHGRECKIIPYLDVISPVDDQCYGLRKNHE